MKKILHISHKSDVDGLTPIILSKLTFPNVDSILLEPDEVDSQLEELIDNDVFSKYDFVFMTDLCPSKQVADKITSQNIFHFFVIDHHFGRIEMNDYPFIAVIDTDEVGKKQSATSLYYHYLLKSYPNENLQKSGVSEFVELVRQIDTWDFTEEKKKEARWLSNILAIYGKDYYMRHFYDRLFCEEKFQFSELESYLLTTEDIRIDNYIQEKEKQVIPIQIEGYQAGVVFAENYHSELGNGLAKRYQDIYDFIVIMNLSKGISYRSTNPVDVSKISRIYGGNGHYHASGSPLPEELKEMLIQTYFGKQKKKLKKKGGIRYESK